MGPAALRIAGLVDKIRSIGYEVKDHGDLAVPVRDSLSQEIKDKKYLEPITKICEQLAADCHSSTMEGHIPLMIGGDHSVAVGSISGVAKKFNDKGQELGVIWVDAHGDINTPTSSESGNIHGMPVATLLGDGHDSLVNIGYNGAKLKPENVTLIAIRISILLKKKC